MYVYIYIFACSFVCPICQCMYIYLNICRRACMYICACMYASLSILHIYHMYVCMYDIMYGY